MNRFDGRRVLITGGGSGIGQATVARILAEGGTVVAADIVEAGLDTTREQARAAGTESRLTTVVADISDESSVHTAIGGAISDLGGLDALVNAAGILRSSHTADTTLEFWNRMLAVNLTGTFLVTREALPALLENGKGVVVNFSSTSATFAHPYMAAYAATKGGIQSFTHAIAIEYAKQGLRAVCVAPGSIASGMTSDPGLPADADFSLLAKLSPAIGQGFAGPETVAGVIAMLASDDGAFVTGTELRIDGGTHA
ncbi:SDR family NAD(P)-dependent oxidoreductase [Streptomyces sp. NPDC090052]|uniref:SDR family NAD(P)-dependent oxidoreductase n=1 Tax=unclassified Streptomyces TaxID=2593676 RepID=UPI002253ECA6|nr:MULTISPECIES: SDR family oxidoreductase [unclassified Streptomyces]MCX4728505.1 SDR family oxidoreductase [Streptomyces sp. NBC_01306]WSV02290.1 SDR family oxidoreductase [Streptomyces sp. NBC_01020]WSX40356.1 SDR family oxidoreductase [Streptomyces sp. NBC_00963]WSX71673.1 SDR family oxidoreductase [Streptomyces sp. NBC_00932]